MQPRKNARAGLLGLSLAAGLASCGGPTAQTNPPASLPVVPVAHDSARAALTTPAPDATSTTADSAAARTSVTPR